MQPLIAFLTLTGIHGLFVMAEFAMVKTSATERRCKAPAGLSSGLKPIHGKLEDYLLVSQIGKTATLMGLGTLLAGIAASFPEPGQFLLVCMAVGTLQLVLGQEVPKHWGIRHSDQCAQALGCFMRLSYFLFWPVFWITRYLSTTLAQR